MPWQINGVKMFKSGEIVRLSKSYSDAYGFPICYGILIEELVSKLYLVRIVVCNVDVLIHYNMGVDEEFLSHA